MICRVGRLVYLDELVGRVHVFRDRVEAGRVLGRVCV
jgi:hypothetical protein